MEVQFTPEQEAQLSQIADYNGTPADSISKTGSLKNGRRGSEIGLGIEQANRRELIDHATVKARIFSVLQLQK